MFVKFGKKERGGRGKRECLYTCAMVVVVVVVTMTMMTEVNRKWSASSFSVFIQTQIASNHLT